MSLKGEEVFTHQISKKVEGLFYIIGYIIYIIHRYMVNLPYEGPFVVYERKIDWVRMPKFRYLMEFYLEA